MKPNNLFSVPKGVEMHPSLGHDSFFSFPSSVQPESLFVVVCLYTRMEGISCVLSTFLSVVKPISFFNREGKVQERPHGTIVCFVAPNEDVPLAEPAPPSTATADDMLPD